MHLKTLIVAISLFGVGVGAGIVLESQLENRGYRQVDLYKARQVEQIELWRSKAEWEKKTRYEGNIFAEQGQMTQADQIGLSVTALKEEIEELTTLREFLPKLVELLDDQEFKETGDLEGQNLSKLVELILNLRR